MTMLKIDTVNWNDFIIGDLLEKLPLTIKNENFNKTLDVSEVQTKEFNLPLVNAKHGNNGIMYYGREKDFDTAEMTIDIVQNGAIATGDVYAQPQKTGVLWDAYLVKPKNNNIASKYTLMFLATVIEKAIKDRFSYDDKCVWDKASVLSIKLPVSSSGNPDWDYMDSYMYKIIQETKSNLDNLINIDASRCLVKTTEWKEFLVGNLFPCIVKPAVLHNRQVIESENGIPYVVRTKFNNGIKCRVDFVDDIVDPSPAGVISFGAENATFFYQEEPFVSGRDIYYIDTREYSPMTCLFLTSCLQPIARKYSYNFGLFPDLLKKEYIRLPATSSGDPDWEYMDSYMKTVISNADSTLTALNNTI